MSSAVVSTLHHVTEKKLEKLEEQRKKFAAKRSTVTTASDSKESIHEKVKALLEGCAKLNITIDQKSSGLSVTNVTRHFLEQAKHDPSVSPAILKQWQQKILHDLDVQGLKYEYASLFGRLVTEWIENPNDTGANEGGATDAKDGDDASSTTSFERVGREEMHEQRKEWEEYAFTRKETDQKGIEKYLDDLFGSTVKAKRLKQTPLKQLRTSLRDFEDSIRLSFDSDDVEQSIKGLLKADLFAGRKREALTDLLGREDVLKEMADVLNMDLDSLEDWEWDPQPVPLVMRRQLNGKYRVYMDEELHQAILLQYLGMRWAVALKKAFTSFFHSGAWLVTPFQSMSKRDKLRREHFLGSNARTRASESVRNARRTTYAEDYFMTQLPGEMEQDSRDYNDDGWGNETPGQKSPMLIKQSMLRLATTELLVNTKLYGRFTVLQSDFKWFGPSLPHSTIFAVLKYFGVKAKWLRFFKTFLEVPAAFLHDGPDADGRKRERGIPMSHILSDALGEAVLFCLDFAVNQRTKGTNLYRFHDDLWFWGQESVCVQAWEAMTEFAKVMGLELNEEKTGAVQITSNGKSEKPAAKLPAGKIRWGFLELNSKNGRWVIDKEEVEEHITELRRQLAACRSVFAWVQAYNSYVDRFFTNNFGLPARCFGREHVKMQIETFEYIHRKVLGETAEGASITSYLRKRISDQFDVADIPDGFFYLPVELGGLELRSPFIPLFAQARHPFIAPLDRIDRAFETEEELYKDYKEKYDDGDVRHSSTDGGYKPTEDEPFMSLEEFTRFREETSEQLYDAYNSLLGVSPEDVAESTPTVMHALEGLVLANNETDRGFTKHWGSMKPYWKWVLELYAADLIQRFGGLNMADPGLLPVGLVSMLRSEKVRWQS